MSVVSVEKDYDTLSLTLIAEFQATIEAVWQLWEDPRKLERWWGPPSHPATVHRHELRVGGEVTYSMAGAAGGWWRITAVESPRALEFTDGWAGRDGPTTDVRVRLAERDGRTRMELRFTFSSSEHMDQMRRVGAFDVFPQSVAQMDALLTKDGRMRKIKANFFISLDGVVESPDQWHFPYFDDEMGAAVGAGFEGTDAMLMGRVLYEEWAAYWPQNADQPFGDVINPIKKYVVSSSLTSADWENTELVNGDVATRIAALKATEGGDISMSGSATTVRWLLREGLLDELNLLVHPIAVGGGMARLFPPDEPAIPLALLRSETFRTGVLNLSYGPA